MSRSDSDSDGRMQKPLTRRSLLQACGALGAAIGFSRFALGETRLEPTPEVPDPDEPTLAETEGPFFKPHSPERTTLRDGAKGKLLVVEGRVVSTSGLPIPGALLDFWHCDEAGLYDNSGFKLRGHQYADKDGRYRLETIFPGVYPFRTRHIHVKAQAPHGPVLTTQLYFPGEERNRQDSLYSAKLELRVTEKDGAKRGVFDFVLAKS